MPNEILFYPLRCNLCGGYCGRDSTGIYCSKCKTRFVLIELEHAKRININLQWKALRIDLDEKTEPG